MQRSRQEAHSVSRKVQIWSGVHMKTIKLIILKHRHYHTPIIQVLFMSVEWDWISLEFEFYCSKHVRAAWDAIITWRMCPKQLMIEFKSTPIFSCTSAPLIACTPCPQQWTEIGDSYFVRQWCAKYNVCACSDMWIHVIYCIYICIFSYPNVQMFTLKTYTYVHNWNVYTYIYRRKCANTRSRCNTIIPVEEEGVFGCMCAYQYVNVCVGIFVWHVCIPVCKCFCIHLLAVCIHECQYTLMHIYIYIYIPARSHKDLLHTPPVVPSSSNSIWTLISVCVHTYR